MGGAWKKKLGATLGEKSNTPSSGNDQIVQRKLGIIKSEDINFQKLFDLNVENNKEIDTQETQSIHLNKITRSK